jgi:integrase
VLLYIFSVQIPHTEFPMARSVRNAKLDTRSARAKCEIRREPHWAKLSPGRFIGYRRTSGGIGTWIARFRDDDGRQHYEALGAADDAVEADGRSILTFNQAQERARASFERMTRELAGHDALLSGPYTLETAIREYLTHRKRHGSKGVVDDERAATARILPALGRIEVAKLTAKQIVDWHHGLAESPRRIRTAKLRTQATRDFDRDDAEEVRKRRSTANRILTVLKAALNHAFAEGRATSDTAWRRAKPFKGVDAARIRYLTTDEARRLCNACEPDFRALVQGALSTGARYGELIRLHVADFNGEAGTITIRASKSGKPRHVALADEGVALFRALTVGKDGDGLIFIRAEGKAWGKSHQARPIAESSARAGIRPAASFHILRHTYGSALAMRGVPMAVIQKQLGHADTRMTERHYAHVSPNFVANTIRAELPPLANFQASNIIPLTGGRL